VFGNWTAEPPMHAQRNSASSDAIDAEHHVKNRPEHGQEPDHTEPKCCGAGVALVEQGVHRSEQGREKMNTGSQTRPEPGDVVEPVHSRLGFSLLWVEQAHGESSKSEARNPKSERNPKPEVRRGQ